MKFSEYTITTKPEQSVDPLAFNQPFGKFRNRLYPQFTVLSNAPAYHGMLALAFQILGKRVTEPGKDGFARRFREVEILWGLASVAAGQSILNVTKYQAILEGRDCIKLRDIGRSNAIFLSLTYGTLGHYSSPSVVWGFLERGAVILTPLGTRLAEAFAKRGRQSLDTILDDWLEGNVITHTQLKAIGKTYGIDSLPSPTEQEVWQDAVEALCSHKTEISTLWANPLSEEELLAQRADPATYSNFFPYLADRYPLLAEVFRQAGRFETMSAICLYLFEREYLLCHDAGTALPSVGTLERNLAEKLTSLAKDYMASDNHYDTKGLFAALSGASGHTEAAAIIVQHHEQSQRAKGSMPYMQNGELCVRDRFDRQGFTTLHEEISGLAGADEQLALLTYHYRRDWHFDRALRYVRYIRGDA